MTFDYIIVGAGASGSVLANRLSEDATKRILLIESGDAQPSQSVVPGFYSSVLNTSATFNYTAQAGNYSNCFKNGLPLFAGRAM